VERVDSLESAHHADRQKDSRCHQFQRAVDRNAQQPERQQNQPDERVQQQSYEREGPAENEKDAPEKKLQHAVLRTIRASIGRAAAPAIVPC
jgi:hypothetical protein